jgi:tetratricopeptide (TPR) repeat protein
MRRFVPRALLMAFAALSTGCASGGGGVELGTPEIMGRTLVMVPDLIGPGGESVAGQLRTLISGMETHAAIAEASISERMAEFQMESLDSITAIQLAQIVRANLVSWGRTTEAPGGLAARVTFAQVGTSDAIVVEGTGANPAALATAIFENFRSSIEGVRLATECLDQLANDQFEQAVQTCDRALALAPNSATALAARGTALNELERYADAIRNFEQLLGVDPANEDALIGAGTAAAGLDRPDAAEFFERYLQINPGAQPRMMLANQQVQGGNVEAGFQILQAGASNYQDNQDFQEYLFNIAVAAAQTAGSDSTAARAIYTEALRAYGYAYPQGSELDVNSVRQAIGAAQMLGRADEAIRLAQQGTQAFANDAALWSQYAALLEQAGRRDDALAALSRVIQIDPAYENIYIRRARLYIDQNLIAEAIADFQQAAQRGGGAIAGQTLLGLGGAAIQAQDWPKAAQLLTPAVDMLTDPTRKSDAQFYLGYALAQQGFVVLQANPTPNDEQAQQILDFLILAKPHLELSTNTNAAAMLNAVNQVIPSLEGLLR